MRQQKFSPSLNTSFESLLTDLLIQKGPMTMFHCLVRVFGKLLSYAVMERLPCSNGLRKKHDNGFPRYNVSLSKHKAHRVV